MSEEAPITLAYLQAKVKKPDDPRSQAEAKARELWRIVYSAARWHHNADEWGTTQGEMNYRKYGEDADPWMSVSDEIQKDFANLILGLEGS